MTRFLFAILIVSLSINSQARTDIQYGYSPTLTTASVSDPDGSTASAVGFSLLSFSLRAEASFRRFTYWIGELSHDSYELDASEKNIGQEIGRWNTAGGLETRLPITRKHSIYPAVLLGFSQSEFASRHTVDSEGFLASRFDKRSESIAYAKVQASYYLQIDRDWEGALTPFYDFSFGDGVSVFGIKTTFYY